MKAAPPLSAGRMPACSLPASGLAPPMPHLCLLACRAGTPVSFPRNTSRQVHFRPQGFAEHVAWRVAAAASQQPAAVPDKLDGACSCTARCHGRQPWQTARGREAASRSCSSPAPFAPCPQPKVWSEDGAEAGPVACPFSMHTLYSAVRRCGQYEPGFAPGNQTLPVFQARVTLRRPGEARRCSQDGTDTAAWLAGKAGNHAAAGPPPLQHGSSGTLGTMPPLSLPALPASCRCRCRYHRAGTWGARWRLRTPRSACSARPCRTPRRAARCSNCSSPVMMAAQA